MRIEVVIKPYKKHHLPTKSIIYLQETVIIPSQDILQEEFSLNFQVIGSWAWIYYCLEGPCYEAWYSQ